MTRLKTVRLEVLRHGPPHNQLLSPLTQYLALCGNHPSVTVHVPYEHAQFLARHNALSYKMTHKSGKDDSRTQRELHLQITADEMSQLLSKIPGLISELRESGMSDEFIHFELVLSASELALLPFELTNAPNGFPGAGQPLVLQSQSPLCITRRVNRVDNDRFSWPDNFKLLFVESLPEVDANALVPSHLLALRRAIDPWIGRTAKDKAGSVPEWVSRKMKVIRKASVEAVFRELRRDNYTHVHILAHGVPHKEGVDNRFALQFRDDQNPNRFDNVSASRLTSLVRSFQEGRGARLSQPAVVTIASCNGAGQGSVVGAGSSIAHALHEAQIPLVISSQYPLSFQGSVLMVQSLYSGLLLGDDPRVLLSDLRRRLRTQLPNTHDWASLVAYAAFPRNINSRLREVRYKQSLRSIEAAFSYSDIISNQWYDEAGPQGTAQLSDPQNAAVEPDTLLAKHNQRLQAAKNRLKDLRKELQRDGVAERHAAQISHICGRLASTEKRQSEIKFQSIIGSKDSPSNKDRDPAWIEKLQRATDYYQDAFEADRSQTWAVVQWLVLYAALKDWSTDGCAKENFEYWHCDEAFRNRYEAARVLTEYDDRRRHKDRDSSWTLGNWIELDLLSLRCVTDASELPEAYNKAKLETKRHVKKLVALTRNNDWQRFSTRRQLNRYPHWFYRDSDALAAPSQPPTLDDVPKLIKGLCKELLQSLPESPAT